MELIFVIVILGIITALSYGRLYVDTKLQEATDQVIRHLNYTRHLALMDDPYVPYGSEGEFWYKKRWSIKFSNQSASYAVQGWVYTIFKDQNDLDSAPNSLSEVAIDPQTHYYLSGGFSDKITYATEERVEEMALSDQYDIDDIDFTNCNQVIAFDNLGRPHTMLRDTTTPYEALNLSQCQITLSKDTDSSTICIEPLTGYIHQCH